MRKPSLSIIIPVFNEERTIAEIIRRVRALPYPQEIIVVDDASTDATARIVRKYAGAQLKLVQLASNQGKGAALQAGIRVAKKDIVVIQDADLEYDPADLPELIAPIADGEADVVYGSRFLTTKQRRVLFFWHSVVNQFITLACNCFSNLNLTDIETGYKVFRREFVQALRLREKRFGFEPEVTIKLARRQARFFEVGISYHGRTYQEGKKVKAKDAVRALYCVFRYGLFN
jgi:glycosyltransferase involved in cell wall biosynthesis